MGFDYEKPSLIDIINKNLFKEARLCQIEAGFLEGLIVGTILGGLSILVASPKSRKELQDKLQKLRDDNEDVIPSDRRSHRKNKAIHRKWL